MKLNRRKAKTIKIGNIKIGGNYPIAIQSMTKTKTADLEKTIRQIKELEEAGCEIVRLAVENNADAQAIKKIKQRTRLPIVADIHFHWRLAITAIDNGADKIRLNPGNIHKKEEIREVVSALKQARIPLRIGVNSGSIKDLNSKNLKPADKLVQSALDYVKIIESFKFYNIVVSLKGSNVLDTLEAYHKISKACSYPLHLGLTATGSPSSGAIKSSIAIGALLLEGIGDTIRVSLTDKPTEEVRVAQYILESLGLRCFHPEIISCPTCGRCSADLVEIVKNLEEKLSAKRYPLSASKPLKVAVMGCVVNGPGEAKEADIGVAFGKTSGILFKKGRQIGKVNFGNCVDLLLSQMEK